MVGPIDLFCWVGRNKTLGKTRSSCKRKGGSSTRNCQVETGRVGGKGAESLCCKFVFTLQAVPALGILSPAFFIRCGSAGTPRPRLQSAILVDRSPFTSP